MARHLRPKLITPDTVRAVDREYRDLVMSLRALAALLHDPDDRGDGQAWEPVLANILDAELNQLAVLVGDLTAALRVETEATGPIRAVDLSRVLETAARRTGSRVLVAVTEPIRVAVHPEIALQSVSSALTLAMRVAERRATASARRNGNDGVVVVNIPTSEEEHWHRLEARLSLLRKIVGGEGGGVTLERRRRQAVLTLWFPAAEERATRSSARVDARRDASTPHRVSPSRDR